MALPHLVQIEGSTVFLYFVAFSKDHIIYRNPYEGVGTKATSFVVNMRRRETLSSSHALTYT